MKGRAPKSPETGSQALPVKKWKPNFCQAREERCNNSERMSPTTASTDSAANNISPRKPKSKLNFERFHPAVFCPLLTREILGDSVGPMCLWSLPQTHASPVRLP